MQLRESRRHIVEAFKQECQSNDQGNTTLAIEHQEEDNLPPYKRNLISASVVGLSASQEKGQIIHLPDAFRRRIDKDSIARSKAIVIQVAVQVGGVLEEDERHDGEEETSGEEDLPGFHLAFG